MACCAGLGWVWATTHRFKKGGSSSLPPAREAAREAARCGGEGQGQLPHRDLRLARWTELKRGSGGQVVSQAGKRKSGQAGGQADERAGRRGSRQAVGRMESGQAIGRAGKRTSGQVHAHLCLCARPSRRCMRGHMREPPPPRTRTLLGRPDGRRGARAWRPARALRRGPISAPPIGLCCGAWSHRGSSTCA
eukprot:364964-Chlamydomonas_euryale.AAC.16